MNTDFPKNAKIIDVRSPDECIGGSLANSVNIPLYELPARLDECELFN